MKIVKKENADLSKYAETSTVLDYSFQLNEKIMDFCINTISGRYPEKGYCSNTECDEMGYVIEGNGEIFQKDLDSISFKAGDLIFVKKGDIYYWNGNFKIILICTPAWSKEQCMLYE